MPRKTCGRCGVRRDSSQFSPDRRYKDGLAWKCKKCDREAAAQYYREHASQVRVRTTEKARERDAQARAQALAIYGGRCAECGSDDALEFDHVNNDGAAHRRLENGKSMIRRIAKLGAPLPDWQLQLLCATCHTIKTKERWEQDAVDEHVDRAARR